MVGTAHTANGVTIVPTDEDLALGIQHGRRDDLIALVERHYDALTGYLYRMTNGDRLLSEDMVQETFLRALRGIGGYEYPRPFKPWLYAIATNLARNHFKRADTRHTMSVPADDALEQSGGPIRSPEDVLVADDQVRAAVAALDRLPDHQREVILLRYTQDLSLAEIADALSIPVGTVKSRLSLALQRLREEMERQG
jgi:RNA polymerase sigma-70 factor (ECF subfamily)